MSRGALTKSNESAIVAEIERPIRIAQSIACGFEIDTMDSS